MRLLDYFFYVLVNGQMKVFRKSEWYSIFSAGAFLGLWLAWLIVSIIFTTGLIKPYWLVEKIANSTNFQFFFLAIITALPLIHYWRYEIGNKLKYSDIVDKRNSMNKYVRVVYYVLFLILIIGIPVLYFVTARLYTFGQVKWW